MILSIPAVSFFVGDPSLVCFSNHVYYQQDNPEKPIKLKKQEKTTLKKTFSMFSLSNLGPWDLGLLDTESQMWLLQDATRCCNRGKIMRVWWMTGLDCNFLNFFKNQHVQKMANANYSKQWIWLDFRPLIFEKEPTGANGESTKLTLWSEAKRLHQKFKFKHLESKY